MPRAEADIFRSELSVPGRPKVFKPEAYLAAKRERELHKVANNILRLTRKSYRYLLEHENSGHMFTEDLPGNTVQIRSFRHEGPVVTWGVVSTPRSVHSIAEATDITIDLQKDRLSAQRDFFAYDPAQPAEYQLSQMSVERPAEILDPYDELTAPDIELSLIRVRTYLRKQNVSPVHGLVSLDPLQ